MPAFGDTNSRAPGRLVTLHNGERAYAPSCGHSLCETNALQENECVDGYGCNFPVLPVRFPARRIGMRNGVPVYGIVTECHMQPQEAGDNVSFVAKDLWPPYGITAALKLQIVGRPEHTIPCFDTNCPYIWMTYQGAGQWEGDIPIDDTTIHCVVQIEDYQDPDRPNPPYPPRRAWTMTVSGCTAEVTSAVHVTCFFPFAATCNANIDFAADGTKCCTTTDGTSFISFALTGYTNRRVPARFIDFDGQEQFGWTNCCVVTPVTCGTLDFGCCPDTGVPGLLVADISGCETCSASTLDLIVLEVGGEWFGSGVTCNGESFSIDVICTDGGVGEVGTWTAFIGCSGNEVELTLLSSQCDPFLQLWEVPPGGVVGDCCLEGAIITITAP